ncbi:AMP-dependent synthetase/ligase [Dethiobacter alkaliphilus]|uniref:AMP-dependent synthetase/ligase n=1 Tax=Dethiobacter alkaliphilus TaxID=427926 RepID=UPI002226620A|nr:long-chain fatty acid--CoA ligase [Dethiobacter alkaliphilus]MCW3491026.1 long-chain fatty acid--CoA ligase [Dethiobacter alkaliphilus]
MEKVWPKEYTQSINTVFQAQVKKLGDKDMILEKKDGAYTPKSWNEVAAEVKGLSLGLVSLGVQPKDRVALMMTTQGNWLISDLAILSAAAINVPVYPTNRGQQIAHILNDSEAGVIIVGSVDLLREIWQVWDTIPKLKTIIIPTGSKSEHALSDITGHLGDERQVLEFAEVQEMGREFARENPVVYQERWQSVEKDDLASVLYTSGTTGNPKGVMLTHDNFLSNVRNALERVEVHDWFVTLSFLPLSHVLERTAGYYMPMLVGCTIAYAESIDTLADNMQEVRPHFFVSVPRVYEKVYAGIMDKVNAGSPIKKRIFFWAKGVARQNAQLFVEGKEPSGIFGFKFSLADKLVFSTIRERIGGRLQFCISGGAPLGRELAEFFNGMNIRILEGYGLTETSPIITFNCLKNMRYGSVGQVIAQGEVRIDEDGEILSKGPQNCPGYYNNPEATEELLAGDWLKTGDIGYLDKEGFLFITDRKKDIIVTSGGKNVAPQPLEGLMTSDRYIQQAVIQGDKKNYLVAVLVPNFEQLEGYAKEKGLQYGSRSELLKLPEVRKLYAKRVAKALQDEPRFAQVKRIYLMENEFTLEAKELTPTLKIKRRFVFEKYKDIFEALYSGTDDAIEVEYKPEIAPVQSTNASKSTGA